MGFFKFQEHSVSDKFVYVYGGLSQADLEQLVDHKMRSMGYKHLGKGMYEKGNRTMRFILGGFSKYLKFKVTMNANDPDNLKVGVEKGMGGYMGGALGIIQMNNALAELKQIFTTI